jgi:photosystem II stability/assembly factor-like uncharacterized protein
MRPRGFQTLVLGFGVLALVTSLACTDASRPQSAGQQQVDTAALQRPFEFQAAPPDDFMLAQRLTGGPISLGAFQRAADQALDLGGAAAASTAAAGNQWQFVGPTNIGGRVVDIAVDPVLADTVYIAAASGGIWKSTNAGDTFQEAWPRDNVQAMGALAITPNATLFAGTGESNPGGGSLSYGGDGVYRSTDRGLTWQHVGLGNTQRISEIVVHPTNPNIIFVAATGHLFSPGGARGLYRSTDGGNTWSLILAGDTPTTGASDIAINPANPNRMYVAMWDHLRVPNLRTYGGIGSGIYRSDNGGNSWTRLGVAQGLPAPNADIGRIGIALAPSNPSQLYAIYIDTSGDFAGNGGFFVSANGGDLWTNLPDDPVLNLSQSTFGWWFGRLWVDPVDPAHVWGAGVPLVESVTGGTTWAADLVTVHADQHAMAWDPKVPGRVYLGNDGGFYRSDTGGAIATYTKSTFEPYTQFYTVDVGEQDPTRIVGGAQDNGSLRSYPTDWNSHGGGDGEENLINPVEQNRIYFCSQYGACSRSTDGGDTSSGFGPRTGNRSVRPNNWLTPIVFDPNNPAIMYTGGNVLHRSTDHAATWTPISPDLSTGPCCDPQYPFGTLTAIGVGKTDSNVLFAGLDEGRLWTSKNLGSSWTQLLDDDIPGTWVTRVIVDPTNHDVAYATFSGFRTGNHTPYVSKTVDGGTTWTNISGNLPQAPVNGIVLQGSAIYVATDVGVFVTRNGGTSWSKFGTDLPNVPITDIRLHAPSQSLFAGTFGRGIWKVSTCRTTSRRQSIPCPS